MKRLLAWITSFAFVLSPQIAFSQILLPILTGGFVGGGGGGPANAPTKDGAGGSAQPNGATSAATGAISSAGTTDLVVCGLSLGGYGNAISGVSVSGSTLGAFTEIQSLTIGATVFQYSGVWVAQAASALSGETITATWTGTQSGVFGCQPYQHAANLITKVKNTDYAAASSNNSSSTTQSQTLTTKGVSNSLLFATGSNWGQYAFTPDANTTVLFAQGSNVWWAGNGNAAVSAGSHAIGGTIATASYNIITAVELLGQ